MSEIDNNEFFKVVAAMRLIKQQQRQEKKSLPKPEKTKDGGMCIQVFDGSGDAPPEPVPPISMGDILGFDGPHTPADPNDLPVIYHPSFWKRIGQFLWWPVKNIIGVEQFKLWMFIIALSGLIWAGVVGLMYLRSKPQPASHTATQAPDKSAPQTSASSGSLHP